MLKVEKLEEGDHVQKRFQRFCVYDCAVSGIDTGFAMIVSSLEAVFLSSFYSENKEKKKKTDKIR